MIHLGGSPDVAEQIFRFAIAGTIFGELVTVDTSVSSTFHMEKAVNLNRFITSSNFL